MAQLDCDRLRLAESEAASSSPRSGADSHGAASVAVTPEQHQARAALLATPMQDWSEEQVRHAKQKTTPMKNDNNDNNDQFTHKQTEEVVGCRPMSTSITEKEEHQHGNTQTVAVALGWKRRHWNATGICRREKSTAR